MQTLDKPKKIPGINGLAYFSAESMTNDKKVFRDFDHDDGGVCVAADDLRHDRRVDNLRSTLLNLFSVFANGTAHLFE
jgi:hypothetical protein